MKRKGGSEWNKFGGEEETIARVNPKQRREQRKKL